MTRDLLSIQRIYPNTLHCLFQIHLLTFILHAIFRIEIYFFTIYKSIFNNWQYFLYWLNSQVPLHNSCAQYKIFCICLQHHEQVWIMLTLNDSLILFDGSTWDLTCQPAQYYNLFITDVWIGSVLCNFPDMSDYC